MDTSFFSQLNYLHIFVAALAYFFLGATWYGPLFSKPWMRHHSINPNAANAKQGLAGIMITSFVLTLIISLALAILINRLQLTQAASGIKLGTFTGLAFSAVSISMTYLYLKKHSSLHLIEGLYHTFGQIIAGVILCVWH